MHAIIRNILHFPSREISPPARAAAALSLESLKNRCASVPTTLNFDRVQPIGPLSYRYVDDGLWENKVRRVPNVSALATRTLQEARTHAEEGRTLPSFDALCERELQRRHPGGFCVGGMQGLIEKHFCYLLKALFGSATYFTDQAKKKYKRQIAYSASNRDNLHSQIRITDPELRAALQLQNDDTLSTTHSFSPNSPINGQSYKNAAGEIVYLSEAVSSSNDRESPTVGNLRKVSTKEGKLIAYTGRVETEAKAEEQAAFIFFEQLKGQGEGVRRVETPVGTEYELDYVVHATISTPYFMKTTFPGLVPFSERACLEEQIASLQALHAKGPITLTDPETGNTYKVRCNPVVFSDALNCLVKLEHSLPPFVTGSAYAALVSEKGAEALQTLTDKKIAALQEELTRTPSENTARKQELEAQIATLKKICNLMLDSNELEPEERIFYRDYLCKLLGLPTVYHCKSSSDRTGIVIAMSTALRQWLDLGLALPESPKDVLQDVRFKELFAANLMTGHQITRYARATEGSVDGMRLCQHQVGFRFGNGVFQNPIVQKLLPDRYLTTYPLRYKITAAPLLILGHLVLIPILALTVLVRLGMYLASGCKKTEYLTAWKHVFPMSIATSVLGSLRWIPSKVLNGASPQVGGRFLLAKQPPACTEFHTRCLTKESRRTPPVYNIREARTSAEYRKGLSFFRKHTVEKTINHSCFPNPIKRAFAEMSRKRSENSSYDFSTELASLKTETCNTLERDVARYSLRTKSRQLIINGKRFGIAPAPEKTLASIKEEARAQVREIYSLLRQFYLTRDPTLANPDKILDLEEKILSIIDNLHQGGAADLLVVLQREFQTDNFLLTGNNAYTMEVQLDPDEILPDGTRGSLIFKRRLLIEIVSQATIERRPARIGVAQDENGMAPFNEAAYQAEGLVFAESVEEFTASSELPVRIGVL